VTAESDVALDLFVSWLGHTYERGFRVTGRDDHVAVLSDGAHQITVCVRSLVADEDGAWNERLRRLEEIIGDGLPVRAALWVPAGATPAEGEPNLSEFVANVREAIVRLGPMERSHVELPVRLLLRKTSDIGGVVSVSGGLSPHWARFSEHVRGSYDLDSTRLHRLPDSGEYLDALIEEIVQRAGEMSVGETVAIETADCWTVQRLAGEGGVTVIGMPPLEPGEMGLAVRRGFRRILNEDGERLRQADGGLKALVVMGCYARMDQEGATTAMRGYDPASYRGLDFVCLVADGQVKPLIQMPDELTPWSKAG
jgi:hypothetical protein